MFFKQKSDIMFRNYEAFGYITDNRNFRYRQTNNDKNNIGDKIVSQSGAIFLSVLSRKSKTLDELVKEISKQFIGADIEILKNDVKEFYNMLEQDGFIVSGETDKECNEKDTRLESEIEKKDFSSTIVRHEKSTQEFLEEYFKGKPQLTNLHIEITSRCNERCVHCYIPHESKVRDIEPDLFYDVLNQCKEMRLLHLTLSGGEPMIHKKFIDYLRKCREYDFSVNVLSNLILLDKKIIAEMKKNHLLGVQTSLYSMDSKIHDEITQVDGSFKKTKAAILKLIENDIPVQISCPIMKQNKNSYNAVLSWAKEHKIPVESDYVIIAGYNNTMQNLSNRLSISELEEVINDIIVNDTGYLKNIENEAEQKKNIAPNDIVCSVCHSSICVADNGDVYPCAGWQGYIVGNIKEISLKEIWDRSEKVQYLRNLRKKDFPKCIPLLSGLTFETLQKWL